MKGVAVIVLAMVVLIMGALAVPVMADKTDGQWVPVTSTSTSPPSVIPGETSVTDGGIVQLRGQKVTFTAITTIGSTPYNVYVRAVIDATFNPKTGDFNARIDDVWCIGSPGSPNGFAGRSEEKYYGVTTLPPPTSADWLTQHMVLQGFGSFEGQTIIARADGPMPGGSLLIGYCLIKG